jgi:hypothetical protein
MRSSRDIGEMSAPNTKDYNAVFFVNSVYESSAFNSQSLQAALAKEPLSTRFVVGATQAVFGLWMSPGRNLQRSRREQASG